MSMFATRFWRSMPTGSIQRRLHEECHKELHEESSRETGQVMV